MNYSQWFRYQCELENVMLGFCKVLVYTGDFDTRVRDYTVFSTVQNEAFNTEIYVYCSSDEKELKKNYGKKC